MCANGFYFYRCGFFIAVSLLSIPCMMYYKKKEKKEHQLISENRDQAVLQIYGDPIRIDGKIFPNMNTWEVSFLTIP